MPDYAYRKSSGVATVLSFFWCGVGQIYNGQITKGILFAVTYTMLVLLLIFSLLSGSQGLALSYGIAIVAFWIFGMVDARGIAEAINQGQKVGALRGLFIGIGITYGILMVGVGLSTVVQSGPSEKNKPTNTGALLPVQKYLGALAIGNTGTNTGSSASTQKPPSAAEESYIPKVKIEDIRIGEGYGQLDVPGYSPKKPTISGRIRNAGDRSLKTVQITVYFLDRSDRAIAEKRYMLVDTDALLSNSSPLKPNYVREFGFVIDNDDVTLSEWAKTVDIDISKLEFAD